MVTIKGNQTDRLTIISHKAPVSYDSTLSPMGRYTHTNLIDYWIQPATIHGHISAFRCSFHFHILHDQYQFCNSKILLEFDWHVVQTVDETFKATLDYASSRTAQNTTKMMLDYISGQAVRTLLSIQTVQNVPQGAKVRLLLCQTKRTVRNGYSLRSTLCVMFATTLTYDRAQGEPALKWIQRHCRYDWRNGRWSILL